MTNGAHKPASNMVFAIMGVTGTGKSSFIRLLTNDDTICIGHNHDSETSHIHTAHYIDQATGRQVMLIDTPGFDDSRGGATDTDILQQIVDYLEPENGESRKLNGIIYMHRISDPRVDGVSRKNLRLFRSLCGEKTLVNVRVVTTNWSRVTEEEGNYREADLMNGVFKPLIDARARMRRHADTIESALDIMSELIPLGAITTVIQEEVQAGMTLGETSAGRVLTAEMWKLQRKHEQDMASLKKAMEKAAKESNEALRAEFERERKALEDKINRLEVDQAKLEKTLEEHREAERKRRADEKVVLALRADQWDDERSKLLAEVTAVHEHATRLKNGTAKEREETEWQISDADGKTAELVRPMRTTEKAEHERQGAFGKQPGVAILVMGAACTGKSTFIDLLTGDNGIRIGHNQQSETFGVHTAQYIDQATGRSVMLIDTPGFDDSREDVTDTDLLERFVRFLEPESGQSIIVNGIIYMYRISDTRFGAVSRKNLEMLHSLCGEKNLANVRIVTTNWSQVTEQEGKYREADLKNNAFKSLIDAGARMRRHANTPESAHRIMSELVPLPSITTNIQTEMRAGKRLVETGAGQVLMTKAQEMKRKHEREFADLEREVSEAKEERNSALLTEKEQEREDLVEKMERAVADHKKLQATLATMHARSGGERGESELSAEVRERNADTLEVLRTTFKREEVGVEATGGKASSRSYRSRTEPQLDQENVLEMDREYARMKADVKALRDKIHDEEEKKSPSLLGLLGQVARSWWQSR